MENLNFQPLFDYIDKFKNDLLNELPLKSEIQKVQPTLDFLLSKMDKYG